jgi:histidine phosphotransferase ChpT
MTTTLDVKVAELLCSRLCHELVSPVGAINNGVELMEELGDDMADQAMSLVAESGRTAAARLRCYRLAYGAAGGQDTVGLGEARQIAADYLAGTKLALDWPLAAGAPALLPPGTVKLLLNLVILAGDALTYGGTIGVAINAAARPAAVMVSAQGRSARLGAEEDTALAGAAAAGDLTPRTVHAYVTGLFARHYGMALICDDAGDGCLVLHLTLPD